MIFLTLVIIAQVIGLTLSPNTENQSAGCP